MKTTYRNVQKKYIQLQFQNSIELVGCSKKIHNFGNLGGGGALNFSDSGLKVLEKKYVESFHVIILHKLHHKSAVLYP